MPLSPNSNTERDQILTEGASTLFCPGSFLSGGLGSFFAESRPCLFRQMRDRSLPPRGSSCFFDVPLRSGSLFSGWHVS
ncbi:MAG: hypothetical protein DMF07_07160 [Verrucomicrobia bacterium]|nr:MAG: hypothetical protein DMF07_07160 [Verrucomicrobiota bacterium]